MIRNDTVDDPSSSLPSLGNGNGSEQFKYKGARKRKWGKWVAEIRLPNSRERIWLGSHDTPKKAARAFDAALFCLRGQGAKFNFPDNPPNIQGASSLSRAEIQEVSARYANEEDEQQHNEEENINRLETSNNNSDNGTADWDFLDLLWASRGVGDTSSTVNNESDFGVYSGVNDFPGEFLPLTPQQETSNNNSGQGAKFNFPDNPPNIQGASSLSRAEIQEVAARYANEEDEQQHNEEENINRLETSNNNSDNGTADWDFLDLLWASRGVGDTSSPVNNESDFGVYSGVNDFPGEFLPLTPQQEVGGGDYGDENYGGVFHHHSNLWNF